MLSFVVTTISTIVSILAKLLFSSSVIVVGWFAGVLIGALLERARFIRLRSPVHYYLGWGARAVTLYPVKSLRYVSSVLLLGFVNALFLAYAFDYLGVGDFSAFLRRFLILIPIIGHAVLISVAGVMVSDFLGQKVSETARLIGIHNAFGLGDVVRWVVIVFTLALVLRSVGAAREFSWALLILLVSICALFGGLIVGAYQQAYRRD